MTFTLFEFFVIALAGIAFYKTYSVFAHYKDDNDKFYH